MAYSVSIILPTINEEENLKLLIPDLIENLDGIDFSIIVADDGSSDNSKEYVESLNLVYKNITFLNRTSPPSLPMSIWDGIEEANTDYVLWMDADGSMPASTVREMVDISTQNLECVVIGSRFVEGGAYKGILELEEKSLIKAIFNVYKSNDTVLGMILSNLFNKLLRTIFKSQVHDITSGFILGKKDYFNKDAFEEADYGEYFIKVVSEILSSNIEIIEKGYVCETRKYGSSKTATSFFQLLKRGYPYILTAYKVRKHGI
tara:strand:- start:1112 stop:1894 length:783 start_codon:yes stop_codon:yes gene_type:complete